jgi:broad specificity phosphatase PhoE
MIVTGARPQPAAFSRQGGFLSEIYLIRHGQASFGTDDYDRLSDLGLRQSRILGEHLGRVGRVFDAACCGRMLRQRQTAEAVRAGCAPLGPAPPEPAESAAWDEYDSHGVWNALLPKLLDEQPELGAAAAAAASDRKSFQRLFSAVMARWIRGDADPVDIDHWADFKARVQSGFAQVMAGGGPRRTIAVFTSGGPIAAVVQAVLGLSDSAALELSWQLWNASVTRIRFGPRGAALAGFNAVDHLELARDPALLTYR